MTWPEVLVFGGLALALGTMGGAVVCSFILLCRTLHRRRPEE